jgi:hypothetical protein
MQNAAMFRRYADECRRLANGMPQHRDVLLQMAQTWEACAEEAERKQGRAEAKRPGNDEGSAPSEGGGRKRARAPPGAAAAFVPFRTGTRCTIFAQPVRSAGSDLTMR